MKTDYLTIPDSILAIQEAARGKPLRAFHGSQELADFYRARMQAHHDADELIHGVYWERGKGCAVGCTVHSNAHGDYETQLGIPRILARLEDGIFEALGNGAAKQWPVDFLNAPKVGADLSMIWPQFAHWLLADPADGALQYANTDRGKTAITRVADLYQRWICGDKPQRSEWESASAAAAAAASASAYAAYAAYAYAASAYAASAAYAAYAASAYAAYAAYAYAAYDYAAYASDARKTERQKQASKLIELMQKA